MCPVGKSITINSTRMKLGYKPIGGRLMKQSRVTGKKIYEEIHKLTKELDNIGEACDVVLDELGNNSLAYELLEQDCKDKQKELNEAYRKNYTHVAKEEYEGFNLDESI